MSTRRSGAATPAVGVATFSRTVRDDEEIEIRAHDEFDEAEEETFDGSTTSFKSETTSTVWNPCMLHATDSVGGLGNVDIDK